MTITDRVLLILRLLRRYKFVTTAQIRAWCVPNDKDGSITREVMRKMRDAGLARRVKAEVHDPLATSSVPIWLPTEAGCCVLATKTGDVRCLLDCEPNTSSWTQFAHYCCVSDVMHIIDTAFAAQHYAALGSLYFEHDILHPEEQDPAKRFKTYTLIREERHGEKVTKIVCVPDAAFEVALGKFRRAYYVELERGMDTPRRVAAKKSPGYAGLQETQKFRLHFPQAQDFRVLSIWPHAGLRGSARRAHADKPGADLWLFAAVGEIAAETFLHSDIIYGSKEDGPRPFIKPPPGTPSATATAG